ncbi:MAG: hypothetical protein HXX20_02090 [Chloroflexi bacterium]|nr:hypothetical protein [Chloroflexota bacterium]
MTTQSLNEALPSGKPTQRFTHGQLVIWLQDQLGSSSYQQGIEAVVVQMVGRNVEIRLSLPSGPTQPITVLADTLRVLCQHCGFYPVNLGSTRCQRCECEEVSAKKPGSLTEAASVLELKFTGYIERGEGCPACGSPEREVYASLNDATCIEHVCAECGLYENYFAQVLAVSITARRMYQELKRLKSTLLTGLPQVEQARLEGILSMAHNVFENFEEGEVQ